MKFTKIAALILLLISSAFATTTVTGNVRTLGATTGTNVQGSFVRFWLRGCSGNQPRINGTGVIAPTQGGSFYFDLPADDSGNISGTVYSTRDNAGTGNGDIECGGNFTSVWYGMQVFFGGKAGPETPIHAKSGATIDVSSVTPITTNPVVTAPSGDTTYARLDLGNNTAFADLSTNQIIAGIKKFTGANLFSRINSQYWVDGNTYSSISDAITALGSGSVGEIWEPLSSSSGTSLPSCATSSTAASGNSSCSGGGSTFSGQRRLIRYCTSSTGEPSSTGEMGCGFFMDFWSSVQSVPSNEFILSAYYNPGLIIENMNTGVGHIATLAFRKPSSGLTPENTFFFSQDANNDGTDLFNIEQAPGAANLNGASYSRLIFIPVLSTNAGVGTSNQTALVGNLENTGLIRSASSQNDTTGAAAFSLLDFSGNHESFIHGGATSGARWNFAFDSSRDSTRTGYWNFDMSGGGSLQATSDGSTAIAVNLPNGLKLAGNNLVTSCGSSAACSATFRPTPQMVIGSAPLVSGTPSTVTVTGFSPAFAGTGTYFCTVSNATTAANSLKVVNVSGSSITITGPNSVTDTANYMCIGK